MNYSPNVPTRMANARVFLRRPPACLTLSLLPSWPTCTQLFPHPPALQRPRPLCRTNTLPTQEATLASLNLKSRPAPRLPLYNVNPRPVQDNTARCKSFPASCGHRFLPPSPQCAIWASRTRLLMYVHMLTPPSPSDPFLFFFCLCGTF